MTVPILTPTPTNPSEPLWTAALASLPPQVQNTLSLTKTHKRDILSAVLSAAEEKRHLCLSKRWRFKTPSGNDIILRDVLEKITRWVNLFKAVGDNAVQFDPGTASLPWMAVRFLLQVGVNDVQVWGGMVSDLEVVARLVARYGRFETVHLGYGKEGERGLEEALTGLYAEVLVLLGEMVGYFSERTVVKVVKSVYRSANTGDEQMAKVRAREDELLKLASLGDSQVLRSMEGALVRVADQAAASARRLDEKMRVKLLRWLSAVPYSLHHETRVETRIEGSGKWLLGHPVFDEWATSSSSSLLLLHGIPGSGKSTLCSVVIDSLLATSSPSTAPFAYFYCADSQFESERSSPDEILRCILRQLAVDDGQNNEIRASASLLSTYECRAAEAKAKGQQLLKPRVGDCVESILDLASQDPLAIVIDAVDEIAECDRHRLLSALERIVAEAENVVKVLITSRNDGQVFALLPAARRIVVTQECAKEDMCAFVRRQLNDAVVQKRLLNGNIEAELQSELERKLLDGAGEMFIWVKLQVESLCRKKHPDDITRALATMSDSLDDLYAATLDRILTADETASDLATRLLSWLLLMKEPLSPDALATAVSTSNASEGILTLTGLCAELVIVDTHCNVVRFAHQSVQDFLRTKALFDPCTAHRRLATSCLEACVEGPSPEFKPSADRTLQVCFYSYAALYWPIHYRHSEAKAKDSLYNLMESFVFDGSDTEISLAFEIWLESVQGLHKYLPNSHTLKAWIAGIPAPEPTPLFLAATFGIVQILERLSKSAQSLDWNQRNDAGHTALYLAVAGGHETVARLLLLLGADAEIECGRHGSALHAACFYGHCGTVRLLLQHGVSTSVGRYSTALEPAFRGMHEDLALLLLQQGSIIQSQQEYDEAMQGAASSGFLQVVDYLQDGPLSRIYAKEQDKIQPRTAKAIKAGQLNVLRRFISQKVDPCSHLPPDAVAVASFHGYTELVAFLVDLGMCLSTPGIFGSPLRAAALMGHERVVRLLLSHGTNSDSAGPEPLCLPLQAAALRGHAHVVKALLSAGAAIDQRSGVYGTALQAACYHGRRSCVQILLAAGAEVHIEGFSRDAFHAAAEGGHYDIVELLLQKGYKMYADPLPPLCRSSAPSPYRNLWTGKGDEAGAFPKTNALRRRDWELYLGEDPTDAWKAMNSNGAWLGGVQVVLPTAYSYTYQNDLAPNEQERDNYPLEASAAAGHETTVRFLLSRKEDIGIPDGEVVAALQGAATNGHGAVVQLLLDDLRFTDTHPLEEQLEPALMGACRKGHEEIAQVVLRWAKTRCSPRIWTKLQLLTDTTTTDSPKYQRVDLQTGEVDRDFIHACRAENAQTVLEIVESPHVESLAKSGALARGFSAAVECKRYVLADLLFHHAALKDQHLLRSGTFMFAAENGHVEGLQLLLSFVKNGQTKLDLISQCLSAASRCGYLAIVKLLCPLVDVRNKSARTGDSATNPRASRSWVWDLTPLQAALLGFDRFQPGLRKKLPWRSHCEYDQEAQEEVVALLLNNGADPNEQAGLLELPLQIAARLCPLSVIDKLLGAGADPNMVPLLVGVSGGGDRSAGKEQVHSSETGLRGEFRSSLHLAALRETQPLLIITRLLAAGASFPHSGQEVFTEAASIFRKHPYQGWNIDGQFLESRTVESVINEGPGAVVKLLLETYPTLSVEGEAAGLILQMAAYAGDVGFTRLLLERGVDVNVAGWYYGTALQAASKQGKLDLVDLLLAAGAEVNTLKGRCDTAVRAAVVGGHTAVVEVLMNHGADLLEAAKGADGPLELVARNGGDSRMFDLLLKKLDGSQNSDIARALLVCCQQGNVSGARTLMDAGASNLGEALHAASAEGHADLVGALLEQGADPNHVDLGNPDKTPIVLAASSGSTETVQLLLHSGATVISEATGVGEALVAACLGGHASALGLLLEALYRGPQDPLPTVDKVIDDAMQKKREKILVQVFEYVPLSPKYLARACAAGLVSTVKLFLDQGVDTNQVGPNNETPIHAACAYLRPEIVQLLLDHGANPNPQNHSSGPEAPLLLALITTARTRLEELGLANGERWAGIEQLEGRHGRALPKQTRYRCQLPRHAQQALARHVINCERLVKYLLDAGANASHNCGDFGMPLHLAALIGSRPLVALLLEKGAKVNAQAGHFDTALMVAVEGGSHSVTKLLLDRGADIHHLHPKLGTALHYACTKNDLDAMAKLLAHGADINALNAENESPLTIAARSPMEIYFDQRLIPNPLTTIDKLTRHPARVRNQDILAAATTSTPKKIFKLLFKLDPGYIPPEHVIVAVLERLHEPKAARVLFERNPSLSITEVMLNACESAAMVNVLLKLARPVCDITLSIIQQMTDRDAVIILLQHPASKDIIVNEELVLVVLARDYKFYTEETGEYSATPASKRGDQRAALKLMWERNPKLEVTPVMIEAAAGKGLAELKFILKKAKPGMKVPEGAITAACKAYCPFRDTDKLDMVKMLLEFDLDVQIPVEAGLAALDEDERGNLAPLVFEELLKRRPEVEITEEMFVSAFGDEWEGMDDGDLKKRREWFVAVLGKYGKEVVFTERMRGLVDAAFELESEREIRGVVLGS